MKKLISIVLAMVLMACLVPLAFSVEYDFGDFKSVTITTKAWGVLEKGDVEAVLAYTNKCIELYGEEAKKMQASLTEYPKGEADGGKNQDVFNFWALNDVGTCLFIQGEAYRKADMLEEAKEAYNKLINEYSFAQAWDTKGWFWKPSEAAKDRLKEIETGKSYDYGDFRSETLTTKAWAAFNQNDLEAGLAYTNKCIDLYKDKAKTMQASLTEYAWGETKEEEKKNVFQHWALNDVGTCLFIKGEMLRKAGKISEAKEAFNSLINDYFLAQCWDSKGWFWKPVDAAKEKMAEMQ
ncbi:MAG: tetratricopeptide repeat protein [Candidatus Omnitrophica bacterium]|nr:tetratricopeptide repeat protein [Candidatus Omnitrophota bacterium]